MATEERITAEARGALVHLPRQPEAEPLHDPRQGDVDEWGRSEHVRQLARRLYDPLYRQLFRVEWEGLEKIPTDGGALLVANHAGAIPSDAPVIMHGVEEELQRPVYGLADHIFKAMPIVGTMWARAGGVAAHPENAYRLLREQQQLVLVFPEGTKGPGKLYSERYQLRRFGRGGFVEIAMRAGVPVIPIAVMGAEESMPIVYKNNTIARMFGLPYVPLKADQSYSILNRIVQATQVDTVLHTFLIVDSTRMSGRALHEINVIGTLNLLAAAGAAGSPVRQVVVKSSTLVYGSSYEDPVWFREEMPRTHSARTRVEHSLLEAESYLHDFAEDNPHVVVTLLRFSNVLGTDIITPTSKALQLPAVPSILGFDPLVQFIEEDDVVRCLEFVMGEQVPGIHNVAGDGRLPWSEVASICGKRMWPLPPIFTNIAASPLTRLGIEIPSEMLDLMRYGRGVDNRRLKRAGFQYRYTSAGAVESFARASRLRNTVGDSRPAYRYENEVENFFRRSPAVVKNE